MIKYLMIFTFFLVSCSQINLDILEDNLGGHQESQGWIIFSEKPVTLPKGDLDYTKDDDAETYLESFKQSAPRENFGKLKSNESLSSSWEKPESAWDATIIQTDKGFYIELEWVKQL